MDSDGDMKHSSPDEKNPKRRMKTPYQLEALERVYAVDRYPSETVRADLSSQLNLSDKQLQMWFCHRRLKDRKVKDEDVPNGVPGGPNGRKKQKTERAVSAPKGYPATGLESEAGDAALIGRNGYNEELELEEEDYGSFGRATAISHQRRTILTESEPVIRKRSQPQSGRAADPLAAAERAAIATVEAQLGEPVRADGPALGVEFDPLPPGAFESPKENKLEQRATSHRMCVDDRVQERQERPSKAGTVGLPPLPNSGVKRKAMGLLPGSLLPSSQHGSRPPREFQFLPEQPSGRDESHHRSLQLNLHPNPERPFDRVRSLTPLEGFLPANVHLTSGDGYTFQKRVQNAGIGLLPPEGRVRGLYGNGFGLDEAQRRGVYHNFDVEGQMGNRHSAIQAMVGNQPYLASESVALFQEHEQARAEKKRKSEEAKVAKESEAHVKRAKRELERQELMRRKKEEQIRKELEKQSRDKRKEEERANREKQREEERIQREQKREKERLEKMAQKESKRMEKQVRKEELRKAKEAAKLKAASERATAKKLAKESMDLIEDEQLELIEAATAQGLFSGLEPGTSIDSSQVLLKTFPPSCVKMKLPLSVRPWNEFDQNIGHLFLVWRFLTTFADVIGLWPFTLDEFVQGLHDYDPRLLGEIHIALLKMMVKNIEDAAQAAASGTPGSQNAIALASGGHPQIVEAAYKWGFDIREWGQHLSPLTWPEILRQFSLAAGFGPKWRKRTKEVVQPPKEEIEEPHIEEDAVTTLRSGAAAASAVALMEGKSASHMRRCRYRLTPGTVKYAAFHVLSVEGSTGLSILDVSEKIQKSGLRDFSSSKTPEASIAAALSRDMNLFERVAPSTYAVKPIFRKEPHEYEEVLTAAREKIQLFQSGVLEEEEVEKVVDDGEEAEREEDYDSEGQDVEDAEVDVGVPPPKEPEVKEETLPLLEEGPKVEVPTEEEMEIDESQAGEPWVQGLMEGEYSDLSVEERLSAIVALVNVVNEGNCIRLALEARMEAASALKRQMWAEAQIERRRHKEELLAKLQASLPPEAKHETGDLNVAVDGASNTVAVVEKQNEDLAVVQSVISEVVTVPNSAIVAIDSLVNTERVAEKSLALPDVTLQDNASVPGHLIEKSRAQVKADIGIWAEELYVVRSVPLGLDRRRNRYWQFVTCGGGRDPGCGRIYFESSADGHWEVIDTEEALDSLMASLDSRGIREASLHSVLRRLECSLRNSMRSAMQREQAPKDPCSAPNKIVSQKGSDPLLPYQVVDGSPSSGLGSESPERSGAIQVELGNNDAEKHRLLHRYTEFEQWIWSECPQSLSAFKVARSGKKRDADVLASCVKCHELYWAGDKHCVLCHCTFPKSHARHEQHARDCEERVQNKDPTWKVHEPVSTVPPRIQILKTEILAVEVAIPGEAFKGSWDCQQRRAWASSLKRASTPAQLLQVLTDLEGRIQREWLSSSYETTEEVLSINLKSGAHQETQVPPWVPQTSSAVALRVRVFDAALAYNQEEKKQRQKEEEDEQKNIVHCSIGVSSFRSPPDQPGGESVAMEEDGDLLGDAAGRGRGRGRGARGGGRGSRGGRSTRTRVPVATTGNIKVKSEKKGSKRKLQFHEEGPVVATDVKMQGKLGGRSQSRSRGRPRGGRPAPPRSRGRGSRGIKTIVPVRRIDKLLKEKNPNELMEHESTRGKSELEEAGDHEEAESDEDGSSKGDWEESEEQEQFDEHDDDEIAGAMGEDEVDEEGEDEGQGEDGEDEEGHPDEGDDEDDDRQYEDDSYDKDGEDEEVEGEETEGAEPQYSDSEEVEEVEEDDEEEDDDDDDDD